MGESLAHGACLGLALGRCVEHPGRALVVEGCQVGVARAWEAWASLSGVAWTLVPVGAVLVLVTLCQEWHWWWVVQAA